MGPRFPPANSFEYIFGLKWKELYEVERQRRAQLEEELKEARRRLEADMDLAYQDYQTQLLREGKVFTLFSINFSVYSDLSLRSLICYSGKRSRQWISIFLRFFAPLIVHT